MALKTFTTLSAVTLRLKRHQAASRSLNSGCSLTVKHDRQKQRFTVSPASGACHDLGSAVLHYRFTGDKQVDLMSTFVPEAFRGKGVAALLSQAALDFVVEEELQVHVSCWYIKKYMEEHPEQRHQERLIT